MPSLVVDDIHCVTGWCDDGIREAMAALGFDGDEDVTEYDREEVYDALKRNAGAIEDDDRCSIALAILRRVEAGK